MKLIFTGFNDKTSSIELKKLFNKLPDERTSSSDEK
jgi:hypothetical protein